MGFVLELSTTTNKFMKIYSHNKYKKHPVVIFSANNVNLISELMIIAMRQKVSLAHAYWKKADFRWLNLSGGNFFDSYFEEADYSYSNLSNASFENANLFGVKFFESKLINVNFSNANLTRADFSCAEISNANFSNAKFKNTIFHSATINNCKNINWETKSLTRIQPMNADYIYVSEEVDI